jgi:intein/homing endonuclease
VTNLFRKTSDHLRHVSVRGDGDNVEQIETTDEHPFWVKDQGWTDAARLAAGDLVQEADGTWQTVLGTSYEAVPEGVTVYNIEVEGDHTYFVADADAVQGTDPLWVHNYCLGNTFVARKKGVKGSVSTL